MAFYDGVFKTLGLEDWCGEGASNAPLSMADLLARAGGDDAAASGPVFPFPSLDNLNESCGNIIQTRDLTKGLEDGFLAAKPALKTVLDPSASPCRAPMACNARSCRCSTCCKRCRPLST